MMVAQPAQATEIATEQARPWVRLTAVAGIAFIVLMVPGLFLPGPDPSPTGSLESIRARFVDNRTSVLAGYFLQNLGMLCFLAFAGGLGGLVRRGGADPLGILGRLMLAGATGTAALSLIVTMAGAALASRVAADGDNGAVQALFFLYMMVPVTALPSVVFLAAAAAGILRCGLAPRWLGWVALPPAFAMLLGGASLGDLYGPLEIIAYLGGFMPFLLWILVLSIVLLVRGRATAPATEARPVQHGGERWQPGS